MNILVEQCNMELKIDDNTFRCDGTFRRLESVAKAVVLYRKKHTHTRPYTERALKKENRIFILSNGFYGMQTEQSRTEQMPSDLQPLPVI